MSQLPLCPHCKQRDQLYQVAAIVSGDVTQLEPDKQAWLTHLLALPPKPAPVEESQWTTIGGILFIGAGVCSFISAGVLMWPVLTAGVFDSQLFQAALSLIFPVAIAAGGYASLRTNQKKSKKKKVQFTRQSQRWEQQFARWQQLYYCDRDEGGFIADDERFLPATSLIELIYENN
ncbi:MAG: hypothetical protein AAF485_02865 [Chloroflexota bacterium]